MGTTKGAVPPALRLLDGLETIFSMLLLLHNTRWREWGIGLGMESIVFSQSLQDSTVRYRSYRGIAVPLLEAKK